MVSFIKSAAGNFWRRELLRRTWGSVTYVERGRFITVFVVGHTEGITARILEEERQRYGDILQYDGPDDYRLDNDEAKLQLDFEMMLIFQAKFCSRRKFSFCQCHSSHKACNKS